MTHKAAAPLAQPCKEGEELARCGLLIGPARCIRQRHVRRAHRTCIAVQCRDPVQQLRVRAARQQRRQQRIFLRPGEVEFIDDTH